VCSRVLLEPEFTVQNPSHIEEFILSILQVIYLNGAHKQEAETKVPNGKVLIRGGRPFQAGKSLNGWTSRPGRYLLQYQGRWLLALNLEGTQNFTGGLAVLEAVHSTSWLASTRAAAGSFTAATILKRSRSHPAPYVGQRCQKSRRGPEPLSTKRRAGRHANSGL
jgi:hypothetical protein